MELMEGLSANAMQTHVSAESLSHFNGLRPARQLAKSFKIVLKYMNKVRGYDLIIVQSGFALRAPLLRQRLVEQNHHLAARSHVSFPSPA